MIRWLRDNNKDPKSRVQVDPILYLSKDQDAVDVMRTIAKDSEGRFTMVSDDE